MGTINVPLPGASCAPVTASDSGHPTPGPPVPRRGLSYPHARYLFMPALSDSPNPVYSLPLALYPAPHSLSRPSLSRSLDSSTLLSSGSSHSTCGPLTFSHLLGHVGNE